MATCVDVAGAKYPQGLKGTHLFFYSICNATLWRKLGRRHFAAFPLIPAPYVVPPGLSCARSSQVKFAHKVFPLAEVQERSDLTPEAELPQRPASGSGFLHPLPD